MNYSPTELTRCKISNICRCAFIKHQRRDIDKIYLYIKDPFESNINYFLMEVGTKKLKYPKTFFDYTQTIDNVYKNLEDYNPKRKEKY